MAKQSKVPDVDSTKLSKNSRIVGVCYCFCRNILLVFSNFSHSRSAYAYAKAEGQLVFPSDTRIVRFSRSSGGFFGGASTLELEGNSETFVTRFCDLNPFRKEASNLDSGCHIVRTTRKGVFVVSTKLNRVEITYEFH